jgi:hypothetical protein
MIRKMRKLTEIGICPHCECSISIFKTSNYKRFAKCEVCGNSYALPKRGILENTALYCPKSKIPLLIVGKQGQKGYFWTDQPCFNCVSYDACPPIKELIIEFTELQVRGY